MKATSLPPLAQWWFRGAVLAALLLSLVLAAPAGAQDDFPHATITLRAPGAPAGAFTSVQWQDNTGAWRDVAGWQGTIEAASDNGAGFKQWAVYPRDYGRGPFRWVVSTHQGAAAWATSANFFLPAGDGASLALTVQPAAAGGPTAIGQMPVNYATITALAPDAPEGAWVGVQWRDTNGGWHNVEGWQAPLETMAVPASEGMDEATGAETSVPSKTWGVYAADYGRGPFRWTIANEQGGPIVATSPWFNLPSGHGANLTMTVQQQIVATPLDALTPRTQGSVATLEAETSTSGLSCIAGPCHSVISVSLPNSFAGSLVGVQWQDPLGAWHDVPTWQGTVTPSASRNAQYQQWSLSPDLQGRGPFRWVVYNQLGDSVLGVTPGFMLPDRGGVNLNVTVPADVSDIAG